MAADLKINDSINKLHLSLLKTINLISKTTLNIDYSIQLKIILEKLDNAFSKEYVNIREML